MTNAITTLENDKAVGRDRALIRSILSDKWDVEAVIAALAPEDDVDRATARYLASLAPLNEQDVQLKGEDAQMLDNLLRPIGIKIAPHLAPDQADAWRSAMVMALANLSPLIAISAVKLALHEPMEYLSQVESVVRKHGEAVARKHDTARWRLKMLAEEIERAKSPPQPVIESAPKPLTLAEIAAMKPDMRKVGLSSGAITKDQIDAADAWAQGGTECAA